MKEERCPIRVKLLGTPSVLRNGERVHFPYRKTEGIFYYLCVRKSVLRDELINVFWEDCGEQSGRKNLRQALYELKKALPEAPVKAWGREGLLLDKEAVCLEDWERPEEELLHPETLFLQYFYVKGAPGFDGWVEEVRREHLEQCRQAAEKAIGSAVQVQDLRRLHEILSAWRKREPYEEAVAARAMEAYSACGSYTMAIQTFHDYQEMIRRDLEEDPGEELQRLYQQISRLKENDSAGSAGRSARFYCRYRELYQLGKTVEAFSAGNGCRAVVILGEPGVGKSALLQQAASVRQPENILPFMTHCYETEKGYYLKAFREWFQWMGKYAEEGRMPLSAESTAFLHRLFSDRGLQAQGAEDVFFGAFGYPVWEDRMIALLKDVVEKKKILLFIDDMQWMDELSRQLLGRLLLELGEDRFCFIGTYRSTEEEENLDFLRRAELQDRLEFLRLLPFTQKETEEIVQAEIPAGAARILPAEIFRRTEGNAIFLMDLLAMIREEGWDSSSIPPKSGHVIEARLRSVTPVQRRILNALSIYMEHAELEELEILTQMDRLALCEELEILQKRRLVRERVVGEYIAYEFHHQYYREYVYALQPLAKRRHMHHMVAEAYEKLKDNKRWLEFLPFLIYQYEKSGEQEKADLYRREYERMAAFPEEDISQESAAADTPGMH